MYIYFYFLVNEFYIKLQLYIEIITPRSENFVTYNKIPSLETRLKKIIQTAEMSRFPKFALVDNKITMKVDK